MLDNIKIVLVETSHPGNIGSTARAMKVMGLNQLVLVSPKCTIDEQASTLAAGAKDIVETAKIYNALDDAIQDCRLVIGSSARFRTVEWPMLTPHECGERCIIESKDHPVAIVFGRESSGLTNDELQKCHYHTCINTH